jgi:hypothetical protein
MLDFGIVLLIIAILIGLYILIKSIKTFIVNAIVGLVILYIANAIAGLGIGYSWLVIVVCALGGALGAILVIMLHVLSPGMGL